MSRLEGAAVTEVEEINAGGLQREKNLDPVDSRNIVCCILPFDMIVLVLSFLPIRDLWRFQVVCKHWHKLVRNPSFHELWHRNGKHHEYLFMWRELCSEFVVDPLFVRTLSFLDVGAKRWYSIRTDEPLGFETRFMAMNDGLVCKLTSSPGMHKNYVLSVSNPVSKTERILSAAPECLCSYEPPPMIVPMVDDVTGMHTKMFIIRSLFNAEGQDYAQEVYLHETFTDEWRELVDKPPYEVEIAVSLDGNLYTIGCHQETIRNNKIHEFVVISSYNHQEDTWAEVMRMSFGDRRFFDPRLVVSGNRLFVTVCLYWSAHANANRVAVKSNSPFDTKPNYRGTLQEIYELLIPKNVRTPVVQFTCRQLRRMFRDRTENPHVFPCFDSNGVCNSLVLVSEHSGKIVRYALETEYYYYLPQHPLLPAIPEKVPKISRKPWATDPQNGRFNRLYFTKNMNLSLRKLSSQ